MELEPRRIQNVLMSNMPKCLKLKYFAYHSSSVDIISKQTCLRPFTRHTPKAKYMKRNDNRCIWAYLHIQQQNSWFCKNLIWACTAQSFKPSHPAGWKLAIVYEYNVIIRRVGCIPFQHPVLQIPWKKKIQSSL